jgi:hypothetical protein
LVSDVQSALKSGLEPQEAANTSRVKRFAACERACCALGLWQDQRLLLEVGGD